jgi:hypothetical protein
MNDLESLGNVIAEQVQRIDFQRGDAWERVLRLHLRPRPTWMPDKLWGHIVSLVVIQSVQGQ